MDKENFTLEELLDEDEIIQECKALNSRLINLYDLHLCAHLYLLVAKKCKTFRCHIICS